MKTIDINGDLGESYGNFVVGSDETLMTVITSANVACGFHAGDFNVMEQTVKLAKQHNVQIGAHPGLPDIFGFGRRNISVTPEEAYRIVLYQLGALHAFTKIHNVNIHHVKPHGALYNQAAKDRPLADAIAKAVHDFDPELILFGLCNSELIHAGKAQGLQTAAEAFADRTYTSEGQLTPRTESNAVLHDTEDIAKQVVSMVKDGVVTATTGEEVKLQPDTLCFHGDGEAVVRNVNAVREQLNVHGYQVKALGDRS